MFGSPNNMSKRKCSDDEAEFGGDGGGGSDDDEDIWNSTTIPLPIQTFLWRQTSPFIRPKISRMQEAAAMEQREACKLFEKVLVQNIQFGLSPSLTEAIHSVSRWRLIVAAMPHVMHCCAALLYARRKSTFDKLSASETKLLYTLHWIILDAAEECADAEMERGIHRLPEHYLLPLTTIQTFVYLFAPLMPHLKESDFLASFRLENGYKIWIPLFNYCHPDIPSFGAHAKKNAFYSSRIVKKKLAVAKFGDVFIGANGADEEKKKEADDGFDFGEPSSPKRSILTAEELKKKYTYNENILAEPSLATYLDVAVVRCLFTPQWMEEGIEWALNFLLRRLDSINKVDIEARIPFDAYVDVFRRARSNSLPTPKRKGSIAEMAPLPEASAATITTGDTFRTSQSSRAFKPETGQSNLLGLGGSGGQQLKTPSYQDLRRSSFSGLPGLAGFQALISSTASSSSFGRHGSEKGKHKKQKKQPQGNAGESNGKENVKPEKKEMRYQSMRRGGQDGKKSQKHKTTGSMKMPSSQENEAEVGKSGQRSQAKDDRTAQAERPQSVTANYKLSDKVMITTTSPPPAEDVPQRDTNFAGVTIATKREVVALKKRKFSLGEARLLEKGDEKGRSMPSLDLISRITATTTTTTTTTSGNLLPSSVPSTTTTTSSTQPHPCVVLTLPSTSEPYHCHGPSATTTSTLSVAAKDVASTTTSTTSSSFPSKVPPAFPIITITEHSPVASKHFFDGFGSTNEGDDINSTKNFCYGDNAIASNGLPPTTTTDLPSGLSMPTITTTGEDVEGKGEAETTAAFYIGDTEAPGSPTGSSSRPSPAPPQISLTRSKTDTEINYSNTWGALPSVASLHYVTKNGQLRLVVVLKALHAVVLKDSVCSTRICQTIYNILNKMLALMILTKQSCQFYRAKRYKTLRAAYENAELTVYHLFMDTLFRIIKQLGCSRGCGEGRREVEAYRLKESVMKTLKHLHGISEERFSEYCQMLVSSHSVQEVVDILHAFLGFCIETTTTTMGVSMTPMALVAKAISHFKLKASDSITAALQQPSYHNNFNSSATAAKTRTFVESAIIRCVFEPFVERLVGLQRDLIVQENMSLYCEVRQFISYVRNYHGCVFRDVALSGIIESTKFVLKMEKQKQQKAAKLAAEAAAAAAAAAATASADRSDTPTQAQHAFDLGHMSEQQQHRLNLKLSNLSLKSRSNEMFPAATGSDSLPALHTSGAAEHTPGGTGGGSVARFELNMSGGADLMIQQHENASLQTYLTINSEPIGYDRCGSGSGTLVRRGSFSRATYKGYGNQAYVYNSFNQKVTTFYKAKRRVDNLKNKFAVKGRSLRQGQQSSFEETESIDFERAAIVGSGGGTLEMVDMDTAVLPPPPQSKAELEQAYELSTELAEQRKKDNKRLPLQIIKSGMVKFQFLLESSTPGMLPDAALVAAMLDLKAPVVARAAFLVECCHFVHRCNQGQWPTWMRMNFNFFRPSLGPAAMAAAMRSGSQTAIRSRASTTLQKMAGRTFYQWAEMLSARLEDLLLSDVEVMDSSASGTTSSTGTADDRGGQSKTAKGSTSSLTAAALTTNAEEEKAKSKSEKSDADHFMSIELVNGKASKCPMELKMIACQLLYEITGFMRETHQYLPAKTSRRPSAVGATVAMPPTLKTVPEERESSIRKKSAIPKVAAPKETTTTTHPKTQRQQPQQQQPAPPLPPPTTTTTTSALPPAPHRGRRWSMAHPGGGNLLTASGHASSGVHFLDQPVSGSLANEQRRISFVLHEVDGENDYASTPIVTGTSTDDLRQERKRLSQIGFASLLNSRKSVSGSGGQLENFHRRSIKLKKEKPSKSILRPTVTNDVDDSRFDLFKRSNSLRMRRKSALSDRSDRSDTSERGSIPSGGGTPRRVSFEEVNVPLEPQQFDPLDANDFGLCQQFDWMRLSEPFLVLLDFECTHEHGRCTPRCVRKVIKSTEALMHKVAQIYERDVPQYFDPDLLTQKSIDDKEDVAKKEKKLKKILMGHSSPFKRTMSIGHGLEKMAGGGGGSVPQGTSGQSDSHYGSSLALGTSVGGAPGTGAGGGAGAALDVELGLYESEDPRFIFYDVLNYRLEHERREENATRLYILEQMKNPCHSVLSMMLKGTLVLSQKNLQVMLHLGWRMVDEEDVQVATTASVAVIVVAHKRPMLVTKLLSENLNHRDVNKRVAAIRKFYRLWNNRFQVWQRLEEGANSVLKLPPAAIDFSLPSPRIAMECKPAVDPPYMPVIKSKVDEVAINQEPTIQKTFVAATKTRRKQQIELVTKALQEQDDKLRDERESYRFMSLPLILQASYEPALFHNFNDDLDEMDDRTNLLVPNDIQVASCFFPSSLTTATLAIINLLEDNQVSADGNAVHEVAHKVIWNCLIEDPTLFLRTLFERIAKDKKMSIIQTMRHLVRFMPRLPPQAAFTMYNYLIGFIMHHVRSPTEDSQEIIASVMSFIWLIVPEVHALFLKDLKQILRKEQCDSTILITANVPAAKKIIVHGPDAALIPTQFPIHEDTQFSQILTDSLDFFGIDEHLHNEYFLVDTKTSQIHNLNAFVRDFYFFKRSQYPQISLVHMTPDEAYNKFQRQAFVLQFAELGKCLMSLALIKTQSMGIQRVLFLHEELMKLPSFPRKALETNLTLYSGPMGKEVLGVDTLHKLTWVRLVAKMFEVSSGFFADSADLHLFLNVVNGTLLLHCEDASVVRLCMATYINAAHQFKNIFATNGYLMIVQTMVQIYNNHQTNSLLCRTIEFVFKQFYIVHRKPFVLQMFGAVSTLLQLDDECPPDAAPSEPSSGTIQPRAFFQLLQSLGQYTADPLDILELVEAEKPLKPLDFCYQMDSEALSILDVISLAVTVISYAADSERGNQMLTVLNAVLPFHLRHMQTLTTRKETPGGAKTELQMIHNISVCMKTLIYNCESLTRNFNGPQATTIQVKDTSLKQTASPQFDIDEDSHSKFNIESYYPSQTYARTEMDEGELARHEFRRPRDLLLKIVAEFLSKSTARLADLSKKISDLHQKGSSYELLDVKCHLRLAEIAHSLLKLAPFDPVTMASNGLVRYVNEILPNSEWRQEKMRPALIMVLRRLDKTFTKISKKNDCKRSTDWEAAKLLLKGVYLTFMKHPYIVHLPHLKSLITVCQNIILGDQISNINDSSSSAFSSWTVALSQAPPSGFTSVAVRLISLQMIQQGDSQTLETQCSGAFASYEKSEIYLMNMIYPLCLRITSGIKDIPKLRQCDINFVLNVILNILKPLSTKPTKGSDSSQIGLQMRQFSLQQIGFLGLKILITCFERQLTTEWYRISKAIRDLADRPQLISITFWNFIDFVATYRTPLYVLILPYIKCKFLAKSCDNEIELNFRHRIREKLSGQSMPLNRSKGYLYLALVSEMKALREELIRYKNNPPMSIDERSRSIIQEQNSTGTSERPETSGHRLSFAFIAASASRLSNLSSNNSNQMGNSLTPTMATAAMAASSTTPSNIGESITVTTIASGGGVAHHTYHQPSPSHSARSIFPRGLSFRLGSDSRRLATRGLSVKMTTKPTDRKLFSRRTSYPDQPEALDLPPTDGLNRVLSQQTQSETKLCRLRSRLMGSSNVTSTSGESLPGSGADGGDGSGPPSVNYSQGSSGVDYPLMSLSKEDILPAKHRLQRQKAQNRKSFRLKKSQKATTNNSAPEHRFFKSDTIDLTEFNKPPGGSLKKKGSQESSNSSPGYATAGQTFVLLSPTDATQTKVYLANDKNGRNVCETTGGSGSKRLQALETNLDEDILTGEMKNNQNNNNNNNHCNNNNNSGSTSTLRSISLSLTRTSAGSIEGADGEPREAPGLNNKGEPLSPFEATITALPFVDED